MTEKTYEKQDTFAPYMKRYGNTAQEQLEKNKPLMEKLKKWIEESKAEEISEEEAKARGEHWEEFKQIIDSFRPSGQKLYSEE